MPFYKKCDRCKASLKDNEGNRMFASYKMKYPDQPTEQVFENEPEYEVYWCDSCLKKEIAIAESGGIT